MRLAKAIVLATCSAAALLACGSGPTEHSADPQLTLSQDSVVVSVYALSPLTATVRDASGGIQYVPVRFVSRDTAVATVDGTGAISAQAIGSTYVVAMLADRPHVRDSVRVRVLADTCSGARPDFGGPATAADRALFAYDVNAPLNLQKTVESTNNGVEVSRITFSSPDGGLATGMMWDPVTRSGPRPGIVLMHGLPGSAKAMSGRGHTLAQYGAVVIAIDAPWNHREGLLMTITEQDRAEQIRVVKDLQRAIDVLRARPNVDDDRIAFEGGSWGGATGALLVGIERRLKAAALVVGHPGQVWHHTIKPGFHRAHSCATRAAWIRAMAPIEPIRFVGNANVPLLLQNGRFDEFIPVSEAEALHAAAPSPKTILWYDAGHSLNQQAALDRHGWLVQQIGLDPR
jgi:dienelactone hydrolase